MQIEEYGMRRYTHEEKKFRAFSSMLHTFCSLRRVPSLAVASSFGASVSYLLSTATLIGVGDVFSFHRSFYGGHKSHRIKSGTILARRMMSVQNTLRNIH